MVKVKKIVKLLKKPKESLKTISSKALVKSFSSSNYPMFKSEPKSYQEEPIQDNRSLFFKEEYEKAKRIL